jgi:molybdopterin synthase sulfur carrier subunit
MPIECQIYGPMREAVGTKSVSREVPEDGTVGGLLASLVDDYPTLASTLYDDEGTVRDRLIVSHNGRNVRQLDGLETPVADGDRVRLSPPVEGGVGGRDGRGHGDDGRR